MLFEDLKGISSWDIAQLVRLRFEKELGYRFAAAYPIFDRDEGNRIMYYMIHASDHEEAPALMVRAAEIVLEDRRKAETKSWYGPVPFRTDLLLNHRYKCCWL
ncbi:MAG TPA: hypothetical protein VOA64_17605 [Candidatus Dormibacteraeota bacterium]|nr:hypothetical protein [Candidatus Dormibacteraeota bacterium]